MPTAVAEIYDKGPGDRTLILNTRSQMVYPFEAPGWTDLRVGFFLSVCSKPGTPPPPADDDTITGLGEVLDNGVSNPPEDYLYIGVKTNNDALPFTRNVGFIGYSTNVSFREYGSELITSDQGIGTTNANFWRPRAREPVPRDRFINAVAVESSGRPTAQFTHVAPHFPQVADGTPAHPYATLLMLRIQRPSAAPPPPQRATPLTISIKQGTESSDILFSNTPNLDLLETNLANFPAVVQTHIANMTLVPDALYLYWPFHNSRLRCHNLAFMKFR